MTKLHITCVTALLTSCCIVSADDDFFKPKEQEKRSPAGKSETLRQVPKKFATFQGADVAKQTVTLLVEGEKEAKTWPVNADAELKIHGWWGRLEQFQTGDRVWVWFDLNRKKEPKSVLMLADEISQLDMNATPLRVAQLDVDQKTIALKPAKGDVRTLTIDAACDPISAKTGDVVFAQTADKKVRRLVDAEGLEKLRTGQKGIMRERWQREGLPGQVTFLHPLGGEMDVVLDHEAIRWARSLKKGDSIKLQIKEPIDGLVKDVRPWRERTQLRLVVNGLDQADLAVGQRIHMRMPTPPPEVDDNKFPPDMDRQRTKEDRVEWFLASIYCSCSVAGDRCTGMFYTLASCNTHACGMPNQMRARIGKLIDEGMTDAQIFETLLKEQGPLLLKPHLLP